MKSEQRHDSADEHRRGTGASSDQWILRALDGLSNDIRDFRTEVRNETENFRTEVRDGNSAVDDRLRKLESKAAYLIGGIAVALAIATFMGWILAPVVRVLVEKSFGS